MRIQRTRFPNGLTVVSVPLKDRTSAAVGVWIGVGGRDEMAQNNGVSHFIEHLVFKGTRQRTMRGIKEAVEGKGGSLNAFTAEEATCYFAKIPSRHLMGTLDVLLDMVTEPAMRPADIEKERSVVLEEIKMVKDQPSELVEEMLDAIFWKGNALGRPLTGSEASMKRMSRKDILAYMDRFYAPNHVTVVTAGNVDHDAICRRAARAFRGRVRMPGTLRSSRVERGEAFHVVQKRTEQMHLAMAVPGLSKNHPDQYVLSVLNVILGGNMSSRLFNEVREQRGLAYEISSGTKRFQGMGAVYIDAGVDAAKCGEAVKAIFKECRRLKTTAVGAAELKRAKEFLIGHYVTGLDGAMEVMLWVGEEVLSADRVRTLSEIEAGIRRVSSLQLRRLAQRLFKDEGLRCALLGPVDKSGHGRLSRLFTFG